MIFIWIYIVLKINIVIIIQIEIVSNLRIFVVWYIIYIKYIYIDHAWPEHISNFKAL